MGHLIGSCPTLKNGAATAKSPVSSPPPVVANGTAPVSRILQRAAALQLMPCATSCSGQDVLQVPARGPHCKVLYRLGRLSEVAPTSQRWQDDHLLQVRRSEPSRSLGACEPRPSVYPDADHGREIHTVHCSWPRSRWGAQSFAAQVLRVRRNGTYCPRLPQPPVARWRCASNARHSRLIDLPRCT